MIREEIKKIIKEAIENLQKEGKLPEFQIPEIVVEKPKEKNYGDYATNIALLVAKELKRSPTDIASMIDLRFNNDDATLRGVRLKASRRIFEKIEVVPLGFINFFINENYLQKQLKEILKQKDKFGSLKTGKNKKIQVEFVSANPTGSLTIGNARGGPLGDTLGNILKKAGFKVERAYYINDFGNQILVLGHSVLKDEKAEYKGDYIDYLHKKIKEKDPLKAGERAAKIILEEMIKKTIKRIGIKYDEWFSEKKLHKSGAVDEVIEFLKKKNLTYKKENALWFRSTNYGDIRDRVLIKQNGQKTYLAGDIAYHQYKFGKKKFDKVINIWGADHYGDVPGLKAGVEALGYKNKADFVLLQFVTLLKKGEKIRMSKRKGIYVTMDELLDEIPLDVVRFFFLQKSAGTHLNFDMDLAKKQSAENPVYYVQYANARIHSILAKSKAKSPAPKGRGSLNKVERQKSKVNLKLLKEPSELNLIKQLSRFPEIIEDTAGDYQVQRIPQYAIELADAFHKFYENCRVISEDKELTKARLALISATKIVLKNTLDLMGISAPEKM